MSAAYALGIGSKLAVLRARIARKDTPLTTWAVSASSVVRNSSSGLTSTMKCRALSTTKKSSVVHQLFSSRTVLNLLVLIHRLLFSVLFGNRNKTNKKLRLNSTLRVERWKRGGGAQRASSSSHEAEGDRELSSARVRSRGRRPRFLTAWESYRAREWRPETVGRGMLTCEITFSHDHLRLSAANCTRVCMTVFGPRCVYYFIRWGHENWRLEWL